MYSIQTPFTTNQTPIQISWGGGGVIFSTDHAMQTFNWGEDKLNTKGAKELFETTFHERIKDTTPTVSRQGGRGMLSAS